MKPRPALPDDQDATGVYLPTPAEIFAKCVEIRKRWPPGERFRRAAWAHSPPVAPPEIFLADVPRGRIDEQ